MEQGLEKSQVTLQDPEQVDHGPGIYAIPYSPLMGPVTGISPNSLVPIRYNIPRSTGLGGVAGQEERQQDGPQRQAARRLIFAFQFDFFLLVKFAALIYMFGRDASMTRLVLVLFMGFLLYIRQNRGHLGFGQRLAPRVLQPNNVGNAGVAGQDQLERNEAASENEHPIGEPRRRILANLMGVAEEVKMIVVGFITSLLPGFHNNA